MAAATFVQTREIDYQPIAPRRRPRRFWAPLLLFVGSAVLVNGLFGERGLLESWRARRSYTSAGHDLARLRTENAQLRDRVRRLKNDPDAIEAVARGELGLARPGEIVITVRNAK